jgi:pimeloyl-ACP methyl ester carboxylesterase
MAAAVNHTEQLVEAAGLSVELRRGGSGAPLLVLHSEFGVPGWLEAYKQLAETRDVIVPSLPGYGRTTRPDWIMGAHDLAAWVTWFVRDLDLPTPIDVIGCSLGGWVAAEIAIASPLLINRIVLVGAMGIKPDKGEIFDYFLEGGLTGIRRAFHPKRIIGIRPLLWARVDTAGRGSRRAASRDDVSDCLEAIHAQPDAAALPSGDQSSDPADLGAGGCHNPAG